MKDQNILKLQIGVWMVNIHATAGSEMMQAASKVINKTENKPLLLGVTLLTSLDKFYLKEVGLNNRIEDQVILLAKLCKNNGLDGVVCATNEKQVLRRELGEDFIIGAKQSIKHPNLPILPQKKNSAKNLHKNASARNPLILPPLFYGWWG